MKFKIIVVLKGKIILEYPIVGRSSKGMLENHRSCDFVFSA